MRIAALACLSLLVLWAAATIALSTPTYSGQNRLTISAPSSRAHPAGTDELGRDRAMRIAVALVIGLCGACTASALSTLLATTLGALSAFAGGWFSRLLLYAGDLFLTLPWIFLLMTVRAALPLNMSPLWSEVTTFLLLAFLGTPTFLRTHHERLTALAGTAWLFHARASGLRASQIAGQLWPHLRPLLWAQFLLYVPASLIAEANLGTLGLGLSEPLPSLGTFLSNLQNAALLGDSPLLFLPVGLLVLALVALEMTTFGVEA